MERAYFIYRPRRLQDLRVPHLPEQENAFEIIAVRQLSKLDYAQETGTGAAGKLNGF